MDELSLNTNVMCNKAKGYGQRWTFANEQKTIDQYYKVAFGALPGNLER